MTRGLFRAVPSCRQIERNARKRSLVAQDVFTVWRQVPGVPARFWVITWLRYMLSHPSWCYKHRCHRVMQLVILRQRLRAPLKFVARTICCVSWVISSLLWQLLIQTCARKWKQGISPFNAATLIFNCDSIFAFSHSDSVTQSEVIYLVIGWLVINLFFKTWSTWHFSGNHEQWVKCAGFLDNKLWIIAPLCSWRKNKDLEKTLKKKMLLRFLRRVVVALGCDLPLSVRQLQEVKSLIFLLFCVG